MSRERKQRRDARRRADPNWVMLQMVERIARTELRQLVTSEDRQRYQAELYERGVIVDMGPLPGGRGRQICFNLDGIDLPDGETPLHGLVDLIRKGNP